VVFAAGNISGVPDFFDLEDGDATDLYANTFEAMATDGQERRRDSVYVYPNHHVPHPIESESDLYRTKCSLCADGWIGADCSVATVQLPSGVRPVVSVQGFGHFGTADGAFFNYRGVGELRIFQSADRAFELQVRQVRCEEGRTVCATAFAVRVGVSVLVVRAPFEAGLPPLFFLDGKAMVVGPQGQLDPTTVLGAYVLRHVSTFAYVLENAGLGHTITLRVLGRALSVRFQMLPVSCQTASGLLGGPCDRDPTNDFRLTGAFAANRVAPYLLDIVQTVNNTRDVLNQPNLHTNFVPSWFVSVTESLFSVVYNLQGRGEQRSATGGGFALRFNDTGVSSKPLFAFADGDLTIEFLVKAEQYGGTLFSYATSRTLAVVSALTCLEDYGPVQADCPPDLVADKLQVRFGATIIETGAALQLNKWNQISLAWKRSSDGLSGVLTFYHFTAESRLSNGVVVPLVVTAKGMLLAPNAFVPGGTLALGQWALSSLNQGSPPPVAFIGLIDELRVWGQAMDQFALFAHWQQLVPVTADGLNLYWRFNEGQGEAVADALSAIPCASVAVDAPCLYLPSRKSYRAPTWVFSDAPLPVTDLDLSLLYATQYTVAALVDTTVVTCAALFLDARAPLTQRCAPLGPAFKQFGYTACISDAGLAGALAAGLAPTLAYGDQCEALLVDLLGWPAQQSCNVFDPTAVRFPDWIGADCSVPCVFGMRNPAFPSVCSCDAGYWGVDCATPCPGGAARPCNGHGICRGATGQCLCEPDWQGDAACGSCTPGWSGKDCSIAGTVLPERFLPVWSVFGEGHFTTLGATISTFLARVSLRCPCRPTATLWCSHARLLASIRSSRASMPCRCASTCTR